MKLFHASYKHHRVGDILFPQHNNYAGGRGIYCTTSPKLHFTLSKEWSNGKKYRLYRVKPYLGKTVLGVWDDIICPYGVEILESLGDAPNMEIRSAVSKDFETILSKKSKNTKKPRYLLICYYESLWSGTRILSKKGYRKKKYLLKKLKKVKSKYKIFDRKLQKYVDNL